MATKLKKGISIWDTLSDTNGYQSDRHARLIALLFARLSRFQEPLYERMSRPFLPPREAYLPPRFVETRFDEPHVRNAHRACGAWHERDADARADELQHREELV